MKISSFDTALDGIVSRLFLWAIPRSVKPNYFTLFRIAITPAIFFLLRAGYLWFGFGLFFIGILTDLVDGALARTRNQITPFGKVIDPIADKLIIFSVLLYVGFTEPLVQIAAIFILVEIVGVAIGVLFTKYLGPVKHQGANTFGKIKMWLQCFGIIAFLLGRLLDTNLLVKSAVILLVLALLFAVISAYGQSKARADQLVELLRTNAKTV